MHETPRKIIVTEFCTLDGKFTQEGDWVTSDFGHDMGAYEDAIYAGADALLLGAKAYRAMGSYWSTVKTNPNAGDGDPEFADVMNNIKKIVFSKEPVELTWNNSERLSDIDVSEIQKMKHMPGKNMLVVGSGSIVTQFTNLGLIDEYHLLIHPVIFGSGKTLFENINQRQDLKLLEAKAFKNGVVLLRYQTT